MRHVGAACDTLALAGILTVLTLVGVSAAVAGIIARTLRTEAPASRRD